MGEVWKAHDSRLHRDVAVNVSAQQFTDRFEREARAIAALNHTNICILHDVGPNYLVMELIEGPTLADRIARGPIPLKEALAIAGQIADALEAAHEKGIVHRDLKPANIKIKPDGAVKVLDFGLAKTTGVTEASNPEDSPTISMAATQAGMILGTAAYMSPEQARGKVVDKRADIWAFGVVLHEMLTGKRLFQGEDLTETLASVVKEEPRLDQAPASVRRLLRKCLQKDPKRRLRDIGDAWDLLEETPTPAAPSRSAVNAGGLAAGVLLFLALATLSFIHFRQKPPVPEMVRFEVPAPAGGTFRSGSNATVSPDGRKLAFVHTGADSKTMVWVRSLNTEEARPLAGTEGVVDDPIWSPDSRFLAFANAGKLKKIEASGGPAQTLCDDATPNGGVWTSDNKILFGALGPLQLVSAAGGTPTPLTALDRSRNEAAHVNPTMLPDGNHFLYSRLSIPLENSGVYIGALDAKPDRQSARRLLPDATLAGYAPSPLTGNAPGFLLFIRGLNLLDSASAGTLMAQPFDVKRMELSGEAVPIAEQVQLFSASPSGVLAFRGAGAQGNGQLTWYDRKGSAISTPGETGQYYSLALSPDGTRVVYVLSTDLWLFEFARGGVSTKFTFGNPAFQPAWSADGSQIVFLSVRGSGWGLYRKASNLSGQEELLFQSPDIKAIPNWTHDGRFLMYSGSNSEGKGSGLWILPMDGSSADRKPVAFLRSEFNLFGGRFSPDGRWVAYGSNQSGKNEVYVLPFDASTPGSSSAGGLHQISKDGGADAHWSRDGKELYYLSTDGYLMSVEVNVAGSTFRTGTAQRLFKSPAKAFGSWDVSADGKRFLIAAPAASGTGAPAPLSIHVVLNWTELLKR